MNHIEAIKAIIMDTNGIYVDPSLLKEATDMAIDVLYKDGIHSGGQCSCRNGSQKQKVNALTEHELMEILDETDEYAEKGNAIWVKSIPDGSVFCAILDFIGNEFVAVWGAVDEEDWYKQSAYGKGWLAYRDKPE